MRDDLPRLSAIETLILDLLAEESEMYGLELVETSKQRIKRGTVYVTLARMEQKGYVSSQPEARGPGGRCTIRRCSTGYATPRVAPS